MLRSLSALWPRRRPRSQHHVAVTSDKQNPKLVNHQSRFANTSEGLAQWINSSFPRRGSKRCAAVLFILLRELTHRAASLELGHCALVYVQHMNGSGSGRWPVNVNVLGKTLQVTEWKQNTRAAAVPRDSRASVNCLVILRIVLSHPAIPSV